MDTQTENKMKRTFSPAHFLTCPLSRLRTFPPAPFLLLALSLFGLVGQAYSQTGHLSPLNPAFLHYIKNRSLQSHSDTKEQLPALIPSPIPPEIHKPDRGRRALSSESTLPTRYDMRDPNDDGDQSDTLLPPVRNQGSHYGCWVFGIYGSLESDIKNASGVEEDFSENYLQHAHGFDFDLYTGGSISVAAAYLSRYDGPISESDDPYCNFPDYCTDCSPVRDIDNVIYLPVRSGFDDNDYIKEAVLEYGGVYSSMLFVFKDSYYDYEASTYYYDKDEGPPDNHGIAIVGWDDEKKVQEAPVAGAFIVRNSWGNKKGPWSGDGGYFYVSYYDKRIGFSMLACFDERDDADLEFDRVLYYDKFGLTAKYGFGTDVGYGANWFVPDEDGWLAAVGFFAMYSNMDYEIMIYESRMYQQSLDWIFVGKPIRTEAGEVKYKGWHTVKLDRELPVRKNDGFGVAIRFHTPEFNYPVYPVPVETPVKNYCSQAKANPGESYVPAHPHGLVWEDIINIIDNANLYSGSHAPRGNPRLLALRAM